MAEFDSDVDFMPPLCALRTNPVYTSAQERPDSKRRDAVELPSNYKNQSNF
jgi:hypothetical protein